MTLGANSASWLTTVAGVSFSGSGADSRMVSSFTMDTVMEAATVPVTGCTLELWLESASLSEDNVVMTIGAIAPPASANPSYAQITPGDSLILVQTGGFYQFTIQLDPLAADPLVVTVDIPTSSNPYPYQPLGLAHTFIPFSASPFLTQLVLTLNASSNTTRAYVNGQLAVTLTQPYAGPLSSWFTPSSFVSFAQTSADGEGDTWAGDVRLLAFYTDALTDAQVAVNWNAALLVAVPQPIAVQKITWSRSQPTFAVNFSVAGVPVIVSITGVPDRGVLSFLNGSVMSPISAGEPPLTLNGTVIVFTYAPPAGGNATFVANITYTLSSPAAPTQTSNPGVLTFTVGPAIAPPIAVDFSVNVTAQVPSLIQLSGQDEDATSPTNVTSAYVQTLPQFGALYQCSVDGSRGAALTDIAQQGATYGGAGVLVEVSDPQLRVWYVPGAGSLSNSEKAIVSPSDSFAFRVMAEGTLSSLPGIVSLTTFNNLRAFPSSLALFSNNATSVALNGSDAANETFAYTVVRSPQHGQLLDANNLTVVPLAPVGLPLYYLTNQDRYSGMYERALMPVDDAFSFATMAPSGLLSVPATVVVSFAPAEGPPLLVVRAPFDAALLLETVPTNFSVVINASGLADPETTLWSCAITVEPTTAALAFNASTALPSVTITSNVPDALGFTAATSDANVVLSSILFTGSVVSSYTVTITVSNALNTRITASASLYLTTNSEAGATPSGSSAASMLPFNALYLWVTVGVLVGLILVGLLLRRYLSKKREPVLTNEERHILSKARGAPRIDAGVIRTASRGTVPSSVSDLPFTHPTALSSSAELLGDRESGRLMLAPVPEGDDVLSGMTPVCLANVTMSDMSHLGSRLDSDLWGAFGDAAHQRRGLQLVPTGTLPVAQPMSATTSQLPAFDPYATGMIQTYEGTEPINLHLTQTLSSTMGESQLVVVPAEGGVESSVSRQRPARLLLAADVLDRSLHRVPEAGEEQRTSPRPPTLTDGATANSAKMMTAFSRSRLMPLVSTAGLLASPRGAASTRPTMSMAPLTTPLRDEIVAVSPAGPQLRPRALVSLAPLEPSLLPQSLCSPRGESPVNSDQPSFRRPPSVVIAARQHSRAQSLSSELVPVNPMVPVNLDSPRYALDMYNRTTGERERVTPTQRTAAEEKVEEEGNRLATSVLKDHPLFQNRG